MRHYTPGRPPGAAASSFRSWCVHPSRVCPAGRFPVPSGYDPLPAPARIRRFRPLPLPTAPAVGPFRPRPCPAPRPSASPSPPRLVPRLRPAPRGPRGPRRGLPVVAPRYGVLGRVRVRSDRSPRPGGACRPWSWPPDGAAAPLGRPSFWISRPVRSDVPSPPVLGPGSRPGGRSEVVSRPGGFFGAGGPGMSLVAGPSVPESSLARGSGVLGSWPRRRGAAPPGRPVLASARGRRRGPGRGRPGSGRGRLPHAGRGGRPGGAARGSAWGRRVRPVCGGRIPLPACNISASGGLAEVGLNVNAVELAVEVPARPACHISVQYRPRAPDTWLYSVAWPIGN
jgi:hypothetical protein